jgi:hypothetical protein
VQNERIVVTIENTTREFTYDEEADTLATDIEGGSMVLGRERLSAEAYEPAEAVPAPAAVLVRAAAVFEATEAVFEPAGSVVVVSVKIVPCVPHTFFLLAISVVFVCKAPVAKSVFVSVKFVFHCFHPFYLRF